MHGLGILLLAGYIAGVVFVFLYCVTQVYLLVSYLRHQRQVPKPMDLLPLDAAVPSVTVQLPIYNELYVVERLIDAVAMLDYPKAALEIQVLDDSTDETAALAQAKVNAYQQQGFNIHYLHRIDRKGFKAGALQNGLAQATGDFVAIFDADFVPDPLFLRKTLPCFNNPQVGMVQTRWKHINKNFSLLTRIQAFALDTHFIIEQCGRNAAGVFMHFNGTAGIWRKDCIIDAGGWSQDTLTEDLDLSYRAQLKGWKFIYLDSVGSPAELPVAMAAIRSQQYRWSKGPAQVSRKMLLRVLVSNEPLKVKWHSFFHLLNSSINIAILYTALLSVPIIYLKSLYPQHWIFTLMAFFFTALVAISALYLAAQVHEEGSFRKGLRSFVVLFPSFLSITMGLSLQNAIAALKGLLGQESEFVRTPKLDITQPNEHWEQKRYNTIHLNPLLLGEALLACYFLGGVCIAFRYREFGLLPFHLMLFLGFASIGFFSLRHAFLAAKTHS